MVFAFDGDPPPARTPAPTTRQANTTQTVLHGDIILVTCIQAVALGSQIRQRAILRRMLIVGLTGGIATGKTTVARMFQRCGAIIIDADRLARDVVRRETPAWHEIVKVFGKGILTPKGSINRRALGAIVFHDRRKLRLLERIIHPRVASEQRRLIRRIAERSPQAIVVYEVPLLFESGAHKRVDKIIVVTADRETQIARLKQRNGLTRRDALRRIKNQMPLSRKIRRADVVLDGTHDRAAIRREVRRLIRSFRQTPAHM
jgi:dephospho-CoA kinase